MVRAYIKVNAGTIKRRSKWILFHLNGSQSLISLTNLVYRLSQLRQRQLLAISCFWFQPVTPIHPTQRFQFERWWDAFCKPAFCKPIALCKPSAGFMLALRFMSTLCFQPYAFSLRDDGMLEERDALGGMVSRRMVIFIFKKRLISSSYNYNIR